MKRRCRGCQAYLRTTNPDIYCDPCQTAIRHQAPAPRKQPMTTLILEALTTPATAPELVRRTNLTPQQVKATINHLQRDRRIISDGARGGSHPVCIYQRADTA